MLLIRERRPMFVRDLVPSDPGANRVNGNAAPIGHLVGSASAFDDVSMCGHAPIMQFASQNCKRLLHYSSAYAKCMTTPNERLKQARIEAGFETAVDAADAMSIPRSTYIGHENGNRGFPAGRAPQYARRFKVSEQWLLYGKGGEAPATTAEIVNLYEGLGPSKQPTALRLLRALAEEDEGKTA